MRPIKNIILSVLAVFMIAACGEDDVSFSFEELRNEDFDLAVVSDADPYVNAAFSVTGDLESISASITPDGGTEAVGSESITNFKGNSFNRVNIEIPFPTPNEAPSGMYTISYSIKTSDGNQDGGSYSINVINNRPPAFCPVTDPLPSGTNTWIRLYVPTASQLGPDETIYATGSFEGWSGGGSEQYAFTKVSETCFQLAVQLSSDAEVKFTKGAFSSEAQDYNKNNFNNLQPAGRSSIEVAIYDWADTDFDLSGVSAPSQGNEIPSAAIQPGMMTLTASISGYDVKSGMYYAVMEGETDISNGYLMTNYENENKLAVAVPKDESVSYLIVKDELTAKGTDDIGRIQAAEWDGATNPVNVDISSFDGGLTTLYMTGDATDGWSGGGSFPLNATEPGIYVGTFTVNGDSEYLILPNPGDFDNKWGFGTGTPSSGTLSKGAGNLSTAGLITGTYTVTVDLTVDPATYTLAQ